ncbi:MAG: hypothetical protein AB1664_14160 [Thermodesulfobacteriota bacterium]
MARKKDWTKNMHGSQLLGPGDIIRVMDGEAPIQCKVLSCLASEDGSCFARIEILEGDRKGERISTKLTCDPQRT